MKTEAIAYRADVVSGTVPSASHGSVQTNNPGKLVQWIPLYRQGTEPGTQTDGETFARLCCREETDRNGI